MYSGGDCTFRITMTMGAQEDADSLTQKAKPSCSLLVFYADIHCLL